LQFPPWHVSVCVHKLPSVHVVPSAATGLEQPVPGLHVPATWHWSVAVHTTGFDPVHTPAWHVSVCVHRLSSLQEPPSFAGCAVHASAPSSQTPSVH